MRNGYTLDYENVTWSNSEWTADTDPEETRVMNIAPDLWVPDKRYVLRQYGKFVKCINIPLLEAYPRLALGDVIIHTGAPRGFPSDQLSPERFGWQSWIDYAASLDAMQPELLPTP